MSKTLKTIQTFAKIGKIISNICFIFSIIGAIACIIAVSAFLGTQNLEFEGQTIVGIVESTGTNFVTTVFDCIVAFAFCTGGAVISKFAVIYFTNELDDGTPFTYNGAKEIFRLGILSIAIPAGISIALAIAFSITKFFWPQLEESALSDNSFSITVGLLLIVMSFIFKHGTEIEEKSQRDI